ncbi:MAG: polysaccharide deacetylase family protein [Candidatus Cloacimonadaceae bacterium]
MKTLTSVLGLLRTVTAPKVLYFHHVGSRRSPYYTLNISAPALRKLLGYLISSGFSFISLRDALESRNVSGRHICLCSDDGFASNYEQALPILKELRIPLTLFLPGMCMDNRAFAPNHLFAYLRTQVSDHQLHKELPGLAAKFGLKQSDSISGTLFSCPHERRQGLLTWLWERFDLTDPAVLLSQEKPFLSQEQLKQMVSQGMDLALHSYSHADLSRLSYTELKGEVLANIQAFEELDLPYQPWLALPYGREISAVNMQSLKKELGISRFFGIRSHLGDNLPHNILWQRVSIEAKGFDAILDLQLKPLVRRRKSR